MASSPPEATVTVHQRHSGVPLKNQVVGKVRRMHRPNRREVEDTETCWFTGIHPVSKASTGVAGWTTIDTRAAISQHPSLMKLMCSICAVWTSAFSTTA